MVSLAVLAFALSLVVTLVVRRAFVRLHMNYAPDAPQRFQRIPESALQVKETLPA